MVFLKESVRADTRNINQRKIVTYFISSDMISDDTIIYIVGKSIVRSWLKLIYI